MRVLRRVSVGMMIPAILVQRILIDCPVAQNSVSFSMKDLSSPSSSLSKKSALDWKGAVLVRYGQIGMI